MGKSGKSRTIDSPKMIFSACGKNGSLQRLVSDGFPPMGRGRGGGRLLSDGAGEKVPCSRCKSPFVTDRSKAEQICVTYNGACARAPILTTLPPSLPFPPSYEACLPPCLPACLPAYPIIEKRKGSRHQVFNAILENDVLINGTR